MALQYDLIVDSSKFTSGLASAMQSLNNFEKSINSIQSSAKDPGFNKLQEKAEDYGDALQGVEKQINTMSQTLRGAGQYFTAFVVAMQIDKLGAYMNALKETSGRVQELEIVVNKIGRTAGLTGGQLYSQVDAIKKMGITTEQAMHSLNGMVQAEMDLTKATKLARMAQDAAVLSGMDSSSMFQTLTWAVQTQNTVMLRMRGIMVNMEGALRSYARTHKISADAISDTKKQQIFLNAVLEEGKKIAGSYEAAMESAFKKEQSLKRYRTEFQKALGDSMLPTYNVIVDMKTEMYKLGEAGVKASGAIGAGFLAAGGILGNVATTISSILPMIGTIATIYPMFKELKGMVGTATAAKAAGNVTGGVALMAAIPRIIGILTAIAIAVAVIGGIYTVIKKLQERQENNAKESAKKYEDTKAKLEDFTSERKAAGKALGPIGEEDNLWPLLQRLPEGDRAKMEKAILFARKKEVQQDWMKELVKRYSAGEISRGEFDKLNGYTIEEIREFYDRKAKETELDIVDAAKKTRTERAKYMAELAVGISENVTNEGRSLMHPLAETGISKWAEKGLRQIDKNLGLQAPFGEAFNEKQYRDVFGGINKEKYLSDMSKFQEQMGDEIKNMFTLPEESWRGYWDKLFEDIDKAIEQTGELSPEMKKLIDLYRDNYEAVETLGKKYMEETKILSDYEEAISKLNSEAKTLTNGIKALSFVYEEFDKIIAKSNALGAIKLSQLDTEYEKRKKLSAREQTDKMFEYQKKNFAEGGNTLLSTLDKGISGVNFVSLKQQEDAIFDMMNENFKENLNIERDYTSDRLKIFKDSYEQQYDIISSSIDKLNIAEVDKAKITTEKLKALRKEYVQSTVAELERYKGSLTAMYDEIQGKIDYYNQKIIDSRKLGVETIKDLEGLRRDLRRSSMSEDEKVADSQKEASKFFNIMKGGGLTEEDYRENVAKFIGALNEIPNDPKYLAYKDKLIQDYEAIAKAGAEELEKTNEKRLAKEEDMLKTVKTQIEENDARIVALKDKLTELTTLDLTDTMTKFVESLGLLTESGAFANINGSLAEMQRRLGEIPLVLEPLQKKFEDQKTIVDGVAGDLEKIAPGFSKIKDDSDALSENMKSAMELVADAMGKIKSPDTYANMLSAAEKFHSLTTSDKSGTIPAGATGGLFTPYGFIKMKGGSWVPGYGNTDSVNAKLTPGEFVINKKSASMIPPKFLEFMNNPSALKRAGFANGGAVGGPLNLYAGWRGFYGSMADRQIEDAQKDWHDTYDKLPQTQMSGIITFLEDINAFMKSANPLFNAITRETQATPGILQAEKGLDNFADKAIALGHKIDTALGATLAGVISGITNALQQADKDMPTTTPRYSTGLNKGMDGVIAPEDIPAGDYRGRRNGLHGIVGAVPGWEYMPNLVPLKEEPKKPTTPKDNGSLPSDWSIGVGPDGEVIFSDRGLSKGDKPINFDDIKKYGEDDAGRKRVSEAMEHNRLIDLQKQWDMYKSIDPATSNEMERDPSWNPRLEQPKFGSGGEMPDWFTKKPNYGVTYGPNWMKGGAGWGDGWGDGGSGSNGSINANISDKGAELVGEKIGNALLNSFGKNPPTDSPTSLDGGKIPPAGNDAQLKALGDGIITALQPLTEKFGKSAEILDSGSANLINASTNLNDASKSLTNAAQKMGSGGGGGGTPKSSPFPALNAGIAAGQSAVGQRKG